jgi:hypothetical protein
MSQVWTISVNGQAYGPYDEAQMRGFAAEGRLAAHSQVARAGEQSYRAASEHEELAPLFHPAPKQSARPSFFTAEGGQPTQSFGRAEDETASGFSRYVIVAEMKSQSIAGLEEEVFKFGPAVPLTPQSWLLSSEMPINSVRNALVQKLGKNDILFIADTSHNKSTWFNYGPEAESRIRRTWQKNSETRGGN